MQLERHFIVHQTQPALLDITELLQIGVPFQVRDSNGNVLVELITYDRFNLDVLFFESGIRLRLSGNRYEAFVPRNDGRTTQGFMGNLDAEINNEFHTRENTNPVNIDHTSDREIYSHLQDNCKSSDYRQLVMFIECYMSYVIRDITLMSSLS
jgi:hypothetical protein